MKKKIRLTENDLHSIIKESVNTILRENFWNDFDYSKTRGVKLPNDDDDNCFSLTPKEIKTRLNTLKTAMGDVMDMFNGEMCGRDLYDEIYDECSNFWYFINKYVSDLGQGTYGTGEKTVDYSNIPYLRKMDDNYMVDNFYTKDGKVFDDKLKN